MAAGRPTHLASDTWTQSQFQLEGNANARLMNTLNGSYLQKQYLFLLTLQQIKPNYQKTINKNTLGFRQRCLAKNVHSLKQMY